MRDDQLRWVQRNLARGDGRCQAIGALSRTVMQSPAVKGPLWRRQLLSLLYEEVGPQLLEHVEVAAARNGVLTFFAADPALLYHLRLQWEQRLLQLLNARLPGAGIRAIRFTSREPT